MRLVPWGQMLADVQARGFTPISWLRFSSRTALTTTCTASNIRAADSWGVDGGVGGRDGGTGGKDGVQPREAQSSVVFTPSPQILLSPGM